MSEKLTFKEEWYFTRQDIVSYTMSTVLYLILCFITKCSLDILVYALFDCAVFYVSFWFIRIKFDLTYHSNNWSTCKFWTRTMLCLGVTLLWFFPIRYSLLNGLLVALICCTVLYLVAKATKKDIYAMNEQELYEHCRSRGLSEEDCKIAYFIVIERLKGQELYNAISYSERQTKRKRAQILNIIK